MPGVATEPDPSFVARFAASHYRTFDNDPEASAYRAIRQLPAGCALEIGPVFQTDIDRTQLNLNLFFQRGFDSLSGPTELSYQWQLRYRWNRWLHVGAQGFGELGPWDQWLPQDQQ